jgi:hypothetical protein
MKGISWIEEFSGFKFSVIIVCRNMRGVDYMAVP